MEPKQPPHQFPEAMAPGLATPSPEKVAEARKLGVLDPEKPHRYSLEQRMRMARILAANPPE